KKFGGKYESKSPPLEVSLEIVAGKLKLVVPGQPVHDLIPIDPARFRIAGAPDGFFVQFDVADGKVKSVNLAQGSGPNLVFLPKH
ncbi:MAG TPA: hypothetical protein VFH31_11190, partial [Pyrinomonadaceae bacterium]|nr:hypothetical protein [Pyrinomonadaceae bacterium]